MLTLEQIESEIMKLDGDTRAHLAQRILLSLETTTADEIEREWYEEALRRDEDFEDGRTGGEPAEEVFRSIRASLG